MMKCLNPLFHMFIILSICLGAVVPAEARVSLPCGDSQLLLDEIRTRDGTAIRVQLGESSSTQPGILDQNLIQRIEEVCALDLKQKDQNKLNRFLQRYVPDIDVSEVGVDEMQLLIFLLVIAVIFVFACG